MGKYKKYNIEATDENIKESIKNDTYLRSESIRSFIEGLDLIDTNVFISLDAKWGEGKTFFIRQIEMTLKYLSKLELQQDVGDLESVFSNSKLKDISLNYTYLPIYYNAWLYDYHDNPLLSLLFVLIKECGKYVSSKFNTETLGEKITSLFSPFSLTLQGIQISGDFSKVKERLSGKDILEEIKTAEEVKEMVKLILDEIITESCQKLVIFIDELDRCKPSYAIEMLERIKHYFDDERIIFIASVNKEQLVHTVSKFYGNAFDSTGYLNKFFDINIHLPEISASDREQHILQTNREQYHLQQIVSELREYYNLSLRDTIIFQQNVQASSRQHYNDYTTQGCMISVFVPIILVLDIVNQEQKRDFLQGKGEILTELFKSVPALYKMACKFGDDRTESMENFNIGFEKIKKTYDVTFGNDKDYSDILNVDLRLKEICIKVANGN